MFFPLNSHLEEERNKRVQRILFSNITDIQYFQKINTHIYNGSFCGVQWDICHSGPDFNSGKLTPALKRSMRETIVSFVS